MARHARLRADWVNDDVPTADEFDAWDQHVFEAVNGDQGGAYAPVDPLEFGGEGVHLKGAGTAHTVSDGAALEVRPDGTLKVTGANSEAYFEDGAFVYINDPDTIVIVQNGAVFSVTGTGKLVINGGAQGSVSGADSSLIVKTDARIKSEGTGRFELGGGSSDWPIFSAPRTKTRVFGPDPTAYPPYRWTRNEPGGLRVLEGDIADSPANLFVEIPAHAGARLASVDLRLKIGSLHFPTNKLRMSVFRSHYYSQATEALGLNLPVLSGSDAATYYASGDVRVLTYVCDGVGDVQVMNPAIYRYFVNVIDEYGANAEFGNIVYNFSANYEAIADMRFV